MYCLSHNHHICVPICLSISLVCLPSSLSLSLFLVCPSVRLSAVLSPCLSYLPVYWSVILSFWLVLCSLCPPVFLYPVLTFCLSVRPSVCPAVSSVLVNRCHLCVPDPGFAGRHSGSVHAGRGTGSGSCQPYPEAAQEGSVSFLHSLVSHTLLHS